MREKRNLRETSTEKHLEKRENFKNDKFVATFMTNQSK